MNNFISRIFMIFTILSTIIMPMSLHCKDIVTGDSETLSRINSTGVIKVGVNPLFSPFSFIDDAGERAGIDIEIAKRLARKLSVELEIVVPNSFGELIPMLQDCDIDIIMAAMSQVFYRTKFIGFCDPYFYTGISIMLNNEKAAQLGLDGVASYDEIMKRLAESGYDDNITIAVTRGKSSDKAMKHFFPKAQIQRYDSNEESAAAVSTGRAHIMVHDESFLKLWILNSEGKSGGNLSIVPGYLKNDQYSFAVRKGNQEFINMLNVFNQEIHNEFAFQEILEAFFS
ncbi:MAG: transporter substrate-binding domain-containing protein [Waddliaceae bacterium]|jgi:ABC-type amino acid transport substrate-binding protein|nr:transporter substrate-binding domain-containing protein [Waddliaceae bacterium]MBT3579099.1 transporter substrate-binding domain-containing protein [Waddliaceae bacterium]MBT4444924.1 transporter substrate-binding domain-containing protein [Waddliaceae bacterium]MBT6928481.1 transporter substrate-binding domain-containing protein [Waddliaceae bacterium]MBT7264513.1 transporter substrate-binding domain-containing protein [Waddliaceae bacterium]